MKPPQSETQCLRLKSFCPEHLLEVVQGARLEHYILGKAQCDARLDRWTWGDFNIDIGRYSFPVRAIGAFPFHKFCLGYMRNSTENTWVNGYDVHQGTMEIYPGGSEMDYRAAPFGEWVAIEFSERELQEAARLRLGHEIDLPWKSVRSFAVPRATRTALDRMVHQLWRQPAGDISMVHPILGTVAEILHGLLHPHSDIALREGNQSLQLIERADAYLRSNYSRPFDLHALAQAVGTTPRSLQRHFMSALGIPPNKWARCFALHRIREHLLASDPKKFSLDGIVREHGFRHMSRFASYYQELFGERPSQTLRKHAA